MVRRMNEPLARPTIDIGAGAGFPDKERLVALKFEVLRDRELLESSVLETRTRVQLRDAKLGLPTAGELCLTCQATEFSDCPGHFGHMPLEVPVYHPSYVHVLKKFLEKICLACGKPRAKKAGPKSGAQAALLLSPVEVQAEAEPVFVELASLPCPTTVVKRPPAAVRESGPSSSQHGGNGVALSGKGKRKFDTALAIVHESSAPPNPRNYYFRPRKHRATKAEVVDLTCEDEQEEAEAAGINGEATNDIHVEPVRPPSPVNVIPITLKPRKCQSAVSSWTKGVSKLPVQNKAKGRRCKYCEPSLKRNEDPYPKMSLKVVAKPAGHTTDKIEVILMEIETSDEEVPIDYYDFLGEAACEDDEEDDELVFATTRSLLPSAVLRILEKVSPDTRRKLGCLHPEAMIIRNLPVPPNCTREVDDNFGTTRIDYGDDKTTSFLKLILQRNSSMKVKKISELKQVELMQGLIGQYFRFKGAGKVTGALEPRLGQSRLSEQGLKTKWKNRLKDCVVGKFSNHCARSILTGDPLLGIGEIGIPYAIAGRVTVPVRVNNLNLRYFKQICDEVSNAGPRSSIISRGITHFERDGVLKDLRINPDWEPQIGDILFRCLEDGDLVFANRNPSLHKHSLIALVVRRHLPTTVTLNPLLCSPFNADFDGDALHVFAPQSLEALAEMRELMTVPEQMICPQGGHVMVRLSQDALLGAYLLTSTGVFMDAKAIAQVAAEGRWAIPKPAIIKGPTSGPHWTGAQVFGLSLPAEMDYRHWSGVLIRKGELLCCGQASDWLGSSPEGIVRHICEVLGPEESVAHLNLAQSIIHRWLLMRGFSLGLDDVAAVQDAGQRKELTRRVNEEFRNAKLRVLNHPLVSGKLQPASSDMEYIDLDADEELLARVEQTIRKSRQKHQEEIGISEFRALSASMEKLITNHMAPDNSLLRMVKSGSKGSFSKIVQQSGLVGLQLNVGAKLLPPKSSSKARCCMPFPSPPEDEAWAGSGVIGTSYFEGLNPLEFFCHAVSSRLATISQCLEVKEPGSLFKSLMCFLRDVYVPHDGTVRNRFGQHVIQLYHGGALSGRESADMDEKAMRNICKASAGEPVGVLAVTALVQPIYQAILDTSHHTGVRNMRPLQLLQETLLPRFKSAPKASDRRVILRLQKLAECNCSLDMYGCTCLEKAAVKVQNHLRKVLLSDVTKCTAIHYSVQDSSTISPWVGHIQLAKDYLLPHDLTVEGVILQLQGFVHEGKNAKIFGPVLFKFCSYCNVTRSKQDPCIHFETEYLGSSNELESLEFIRDTLLPLLLKAVVKGSSLVRFVNIFWETASSSTRMSEGGNEEIVVEVETEGKQIRGKSFASVKLACIPIMHLVDWTRSAPYSVQELRQTHGIEAAHHCILNRLKLAVKGMGTAVHVHHLQLIADFMVFSGDAIGFVYAGFKEYIRSISASAPFSQGAFQAPWKSFTDAAHKGHCEEVTSVLASCAWGKEAPVGTGADCDILHQVTGVAPLLKVDIHELYVDKAKRVAAETAIPDLPYCGENAPSHSDEVPWGESAKPSSDGDAWGAGKLSSGAPAGWGDDPPAGTGGDTGWGNERPCTEEQPACSPSWGVKDPVRKETESGWGNVKVSSGGWDTVEPSTNKEIATSGWECQGSKEVEGEGTECSLKGWGIEKPSTDRQTASSPGWGGQGLAAKEAESGWGMDMRPSGAWDNEIATAKGTTASAGWGDTEGEGERAKPDNEGWGDNGKVGGNSALGGTAWGNEEAADVGWNTPTTSATPAVWGEGRENNDTGTRKAWGAQGDAPSTGGASERYHRKRGPGDGRGRQEISCSGANEVPIGPRKGRTSVVSVPESDTWANVGTDGWNTPKEAVTDGWNTPKEAVTDGWNTAKEAVPPESSWGQVPAVADVSEPKTLDPASPAAGRIKNFDGSREKKWGTSCSGANLEPLGKRNPFWPKGNHSVPEEHTGRDGEGQQFAGTGSHEGGQDKHTQSGWGNMDEQGGWGGTEDARGDAQNSKKTDAANHEKKDNGGWGADAGKWGGDGPAKEDNTGWCADTGGQAAKEDNGGWGADTGGWQSSTKKQDRDIQEKCTGQEARSWNVQRNGNGKVGGRGPPRQTGADGGQGVTNMSLSEEDEKVKDEIENLLQRVKNLMTQTGRKLSDEDGKFIVEQILRYHPEKDMKVSSGIDHVKVDSHPEYPRSRCLFLIRPDGSSTDFSYHKCLQELARAKSKVVFENYSILFKRLNRP